VAMSVVPITLRKANEVILEWHRHHKPSRGHKFSIGLMKDNNLIGVAICGRPVSRVADNGFTLEVSRLCTDGTKNACSKLYGACARIAKEMGYIKIQTYILEKEIGTTLKASGWIMEAVTAGGQWKRTDGVINRTDQPTEPKQRWVKLL
jgi:hypothetical protein